MDVEEAFDIAGSFGKFQIATTITLFFTNILYGTQMLLMVVVGANPDPNVPSEANLTTIVTEWKLYDELWIVDLMTSLYMAGYIVGSLIFGQMSDLYGRKIILLINYGLACICSCCLAFCNCWQTFAVTRFVTGVFIGGSAPAAFVLMCELIGKNKWAYIGMIYQMFFSFGVMQLGLLGDLLRDWRKIIYLTSGCAAISLPSIYFFVPESPRWLYSVGKIDKAERIMRLMTRKNGKDESSIVLSAEACQSTPESLKKYSLIDLMKIKTLAIRLLICSYLWFACAVSYYGLTLDAADLSPNLFMDILLSGSVEIPAYIITMILMQRKWAGRKGTTMFLLLLSSITSIGILFIRDEVSMVKTVLGLISKLTIAGGFSILYIYVSELFPTQLRTVALGTTNIFSRVGAIVAPFVPALVSTAYYLPYVIFGAGTMIAAALNIFLPETLGKRIMSMDDFEKSEGENMRRSPHINVNDRVDEDENIQDDDDVPLLA